MANQSICLQHSKAVSTENRVLGQTLILLIFSDTCTFTKLDCMVQLRPQFTHVDALKEQGKSWFRSQRNDDEKEEETSNENKVKAVNMAVKSTENTEESDMYGGMSETAKILRFIRDEPFQHLAWIDQDVSHVCA